MITGCSSLEVKSAVELGGLRGANITGGSAVNEGPNLHQGSPFFFFFNYLLNQFLFFIVGVMTFEVRANKIKATEASDS